ncbi:aldehyde dehydrogenase family protein [Plantactinospora sonchi]|uniref:Aldehyde dehydrogenase family protein n=1 Tax=Plantactinospora sonchi TaxID=1544735 RepID=A0ABU7S4Q4_9ACTN
MPDDPVPAAPGSRDVAGTPGGRSDPEPTTVPVWIGSRRVDRTRTVPLTGCDGRLVAHVAQAGRLMQHEMVERARQVAPLLSSVEESAWFAHFHRAAEIVARWLADGRLTDPARRLSRATGLPETRVLRGIAAVVGHLRRIEQIMAAQAPNGDLAAYRTGDCGAPWRWLPTGRTCMVRVPANFPTIMIEWLQVLAARRPVLVNTSDRDPFTAGIFVAALYEAGLPDGAVSLVHGDASTWVRLADQVVWPGEHAPPQHDPARLKTYHFGRSKVVLGDEDPGAEVWTRLARLAFQGSGRLCTNMSALAVTGDPVRAARRLAEAFARYPARPLTEPAARVPAFPDRTEFEALVRMVEREVAGGAVDVTAEVTGQPLRIELDGVPYLRPTVLLTTADSPLFRTELPFPFTAVAPVERSRLGQACAHSLIVSVVGEDAEVVAALAAEPTITKVFSGALFDRGYQPEDPQEGYLADFLFQKKALLPVPEARVDKEQLCRRIPSAR